jgi:copper transport protein
VVSSRVTVAALLVALVGAVGLLAPPSAEAHATLEGSSPQRGATVARQPGQVVFRFDEAVEGNFGAVRVFDVRGDRVDEGDAFHLGGDGRRLAVHLRRGLPDGTYTATYRVVSADSHIVSGGLAFSVGHATAGGRSVDELLGRSGAGAVTGVAFGVARALQYAALAVAAGVLVFLLWIWSPVLAAAAGGSEAWRHGSEAFARRASTLMLVAAVVGTFSALGAVVLEAAEAAGVSAWSALRPHVMREVLGTKFGTVWTIAAAAWVIFGGAAAVVFAGWRASAPVLRPVALGAAGLSLRAPVRAVAVAPLVPLLYLALVPALSGHGSTQSPVGVMFPANVLHVVAVSAWVGGLVALLLAVPAATRRLALGDRAGLLAPLLLRFSAVALTCVLVLVVAGLVQAYIEIRHLDLVLSTAFGRAVLIKTVLLLGLVVLGALQRRRLVPAVARAAREGRSPGADGVSLASALRAEAALMAAVLAVTGALAGYAPATAKVSGPFATTTRVGPQELQLTLDPAQVGANELHLYLMDPRSGAQVDTAKEVDVSASLPAKGIGAIRTQATKAGPGHYVANGLTLGVRGDWQLTVTVRVSDFDEYAKTLKVPIR